MLADRYRQVHDREPDRVDFSQALVRLAPDPVRRSEAVQRLEPLDGEWVDALRHALGATVTVGGERWLWLSAASARVGEAGEDDAVSDRYGPVPGCGAPVDFGVVVTPGWKGPRLTATVVPLSPSDTTAAEPTLLAVRSVLPFEQLGPASHHYPDGVGIIRWRAATWPSGLRTYAMRAAVSLHGFIDFDRADFYWAWLEPWLDPERPITEECAFAVVIGLASLDPSVCTMAVDVVIAAIGDARLGGGSLGRQLQRSLALGLVSRTRVAKSLKTVVDVSDGHALAVADALQATWRDEVTKDAYALLEVGLRAHAHLGLPVVAEPTRAWLGSFTGSTKAAKLARQLLAIDSAPEAVDGLRRGVAHSRLEAILNRVECAVGG